jgi:hypothetical protein
MKIICEHCEQEIIEDEFFLTDNGVMHDECILDLFPRYTREKFIETYNKMCEKHGYEI